MKEPRLAEFPAGCLDHVAYLWAYAPLRTEISISRKLILPQNPMAVEGTYGFVYCGTNGLGICVFTVAGGGMLRGVDDAGVKYTGAADEKRDGTIAVTISSEVPPGVKLVQGTAPQDIPYVRTITTVFPSRVRQRQAAGGPVAAGRLHRHDQALG
ncbi:MAG: hypothetical protein ACXWC3_28555 [Burkholderiales bacterium]